MMDETETDPTQEEIERIKVQIKGLSPEEQALRDEYYRSIESAPCAAIGSVGQYLKLGDDITQEEFDDIVDRLANRVADESREMPSVFNDLFIQHSTLLDLGFRYYFGGGSSDKINEEAFILAMQAQRQCLNTLEFIRKSRRNERQDVLKSEVHRAKMKDHMFKHAPRIADSKKYDFFKSSKNRDDG